MWMACRPMTRDSLLAQNISERNPHTHTIYIYIINIYTWLYTHKYPCISFSCCATTSRESCKPAPRTCKRGGRFSRPIRRAECLTKSSVWSKDVDMFWEICVLLASKQGLSGVFCVEYGMKPHKQPVRKFQNRKLPTPFKAVSSVQPTSKVKTLFQRPISIKNHQLCQRQVTFGKHHGRKQLPEFDPPVAPWQEPRGGTCCGGAMAHTKDSLLESALCVGYIYV